MIRPAEVADAEYEPYKPSVAEYIEGEYGHIGDIDLSEYVKKTDYASESSFGVIKALKNQGIYVSDDGVIHIVMPTDQQIMEKSIKVRVLTPYNIPQMMSNYSITKTTVFDLQAKINELEAEITALKGGTA